MHGCEEAGFLLYYQEKKTKQNPYDTYVKRAWKKILPQVSEDDNSISSKIYQRWSKLSTKSMNK